MTKKGAKKKTTKKKSPSKTTKRKSTTKKTSRKKTKAPETKTIIKEVYKEPESQKILMENFVALQRVMTNLSLSMDNLTGKISKLLELFEISAKSLAEKDFEIETGNKEVKEKLNAVLDQNKTIAKGLMMMHDRLPGEESSPHPPQGFQPSIKSQPPQQTQTTARNQPPQNIPQFPRNPTSPQQFQPPRQTPPEIQEMKKETPKSYSKEISDQEPQKFESPF